MGTRRLDQNGKIFVRAVEGAAAGEMLDSLANQSPREATGHAIAHIGTSDYSDTKYDKQFVTVSLACTRQAPGEGLTRSNNSLHFHFLLTSGSTQAIEDKERLYIMCLSLIHI